jgi:hypothetical protein
MQNNLEITLDKTKISISDSFDNSEEKEYWLSRTPQERIQHIERLRRINYGDKATERLQRVLEVIECKWR